MKKIVMNWRIGIPLVLLLTFFGLKSAFAEYVAVAPDSWVGKPSVGDGECVALVKAAANITVPTKDWGRGMQVRGSKLNRGTIIATFLVKDDRVYYSGHAAIYLGQNEEGIQVIDQWAARYETDSQGNRTIKRPAQPPHYRTIRWNGKGISNNGDGFYVVEK